MKKKKVMIVEDDKLSAMILQKMLAKLEYDIADIITDGYHGVVRAGELNPDLVLMDIGLSGFMDGIEAARQIRMVYDIPVVFVTSNADQDTFRKARYSNPSGFLAKPVAEESLRTTLDIALNRRRTDFSDQL